MVKLTITTRTTQAIFTKYLVIYYLREKYEQNMSRWVENINSTMWHQQLCGRKKSKATGQIPKYPETFIRKGGRSI